MDSGFEDSQEEAVVEAGTAGRACLVTRTDLDLLRDDHRADMTDLRTDFIKWSGGTNIAVVGIAIALLTAVLGS